MSHVPTNTFGFYLVWNPEGRAPTKRHGNYAAAYREAARLAELDPNKSFYVMQALVVSRGVQTPKVVTNDCHYAVSDQPVHPVI